MIQFDELIQLMSEHSIAHSHDLVGVPLSEIKAMEAYFNVKFPALYVQFLFTCGRSAGKLADWTAIYFDDLKEISEEYSFQANAQSSHNKLHSNALIIAHYGTYFDYIHCTGVADPEVYRVDFRLSTLEPTLLSNSLALYFKSMIMQAIDNKGNIEPFYIDECGNWQADDLISEAPGVE